MVLRNAGEGIISTTRDYKCNEGEEEVTPCGRPPKVEVTALAAISQRVCLGVAFACTSPTG